MNLKIGKQKKLLIVLGSFCLIIIIILLFLSTSDKIKFISNSNLSLKQSNQLYIRTNEKNEILKNIGLKAVYDSNFWGEGFSGTSHINEIFTLNEITYIDLMINKNNSQYRIILKYLEGSYYKFIYNNEPFVLLNNNNKEIEKININFEECDMTLKQDTVDYVDPFANSLTAFVQKEREKSPQGNHTIPILNKTVSINIYETIDSPVDRNAKCDLYPSGTDIIVVAMKYKISLSTIADWLTKIELSDDGKLKKDTMICKEKEIDFRYGREVVFSDLTKNTDEEVIIVSDWDTGKSKMKLQQPFQINSKYNCILYNVVKIPYGMTLCDKFFLDKAVNIYLTDL